jgi:hypothetical protein
MLPSKARVNLKSPVLRIRIRDPGSGIRCLFDPWIRDPGCVKSQDLDPGYGSGMENPDHISESLETIFWVKILKFFDADPESRIWDGKNLDPGSGIRD